MLGQRQGKCGLAASGGAKQDDQERRTRHSQRALQGM
jgi:hypothetical protein